MPRKPARNDFDGGCNINAETINAAIAMLHQGRYRPAAKLNKAVSNTEIRNFIYGTV